MAIAMKSKKNFFLIDLLMLAVTAASLFYAGVFHYTLVLLLAGYMLLLRANVSFLLFRGEQLTIWPIAAFMLLFALSFVPMEYDYVWGRMGLLPATVLGLGQAFNLRMVFMVVFAWTWLMPLAAYLFLHFTHQLERHETKWTRLAGGALFCDKAGRLYLSLMLVALSACCVGQVMNASLSFFALLLVVSATYALVNGYLDRKAHWMEYVLLLAAMLSFDKAQYYYGIGRVILLAVSAALVLVVCVWMLAQTRQWLTTLTLSLTLALALPSVTLGYNQYRCVDAKRYRNCQYTSGSFDMDEELSGLLYTVSPNGFGLRDRYQELLPCQYQRIEPDVNGWNKLYAITGEGDTLRYDLYMKK